MESRLWRTAEGWTVRVSACGRSRSDRAGRIHTHRCTRHPPLVGGRSACYGEEHLKELDRIKTLQGRGQTLAQIAWQLGEGQKEVHPPEPSAWWNYTVSKDVVVEVRCDSSPWRLKQVRSLIAQMIRQLNENEEKDHAR